jgi:hypothetical protein
MSAARTAHVERPSTRSERLDLSILVQYFNAEGRFHHLGVGAIVKGWNRCAAAANLSSELLVNVDSRDYAGGDVRAWLDVLGPEDTIVLSANVHELRAYNRLAALARGRQLLLVQDDDGVPGLRLRAAARHSLDPWARHSRLSATARARGRLRALRSRRCGERAAR